MTKWSMPAITLRREGRRFIGECTNSNDEGRFGGRHLACFNLPYLLAPLILFTPPLPETTPLN
uniref:Uncharacterized protein n=1 Tax=Ascaris lumbricoides TaxID=6252 RepID=A0A0M3I0P2_ASCLU